jgi:DNA-binding LytR/AlgR family response regulator
MLHCIIVDDEPLALDLLEDNISKVPFLKLVARCKNAMEAVQILQSMNIDLVFTDIQMPGLNGLQLVETLRIKPMFIFISAYEKYALQGYKLDVVDYLLKPVPFDRFVEACNKALERCAVRRVQQSFVTPVSGATPVVSPNHIFVHIDYSLVKILLNEIKFIEAHRDYIKVHFIPTGKRPVLVRMSMKSMEEMLPTDRFLRTHKSYIINADQVTAIRKNSVFINELEFTISEPYKDVIRKITKGRM